MAIGALDSAIFADMFGTAAMREVFGDVAFLMRCVEVEAALARAQARVGLIPGEAADAIAQAANTLTSGRAGHVYNVGGGVELTNRELTARLLRACGRRGSPRRC